MSLLFICTFPKLRAASIITWEYQSSRLYQCYASIGRHFTFCSKKSSHLQWTWGLYKKYVHGDTGISGETHFVMAEGQDARCESRHRGLLTARPCVVLNLPVGKIRWNVSTQCVPYMVAVSRRTLNCSTCLVLSSNTDSFRTSCFLSLVF